MTENRPLQSDIDAELKQVIDDTSVRIGLVDKAGHGLLHEAALLRALNSQMQINSELYSTVIETRAQPIRMPLLPTRREMLEGQIADALPRVAQRPPPLPPQQVPQQSPALERELQPPYQRHAPAPEPRPRNVGA